jgi:hypothetical protein
MTTSRFYIVQDDQPSDPRKEYDNMGTMACWHRRYSLGDVQPTENATLWRMENVPKGSIVLPLFLLDHSGLAMRTYDFSNCDPGQWDSGQVGIIFVTPEGLRKSSGEKRITKKVRENAEAVLRDEVKQYDNFLQGNVWGYVYEKFKSTCSECGHIEYEEDESSYGFYGETLEETGLKEMKPDDITEEQLKEAWDKRFDGPKERAHG